MKIHKLNKALFLLIFYIFTFNLTSQTISIEGVQSMVLRSQSGDFQLAQSGDSLYARYLDVAFTFDHSGTAIKIELYNISDTSNITAMTTHNYSVPANNTDNSGLYSLDKTGNDIHLFLGYLSLLERYRLKLWIANSQQPVYITEF